MSEDLPPPSPPEEPTERASDAFDASVFDEFVPEIVDLATKVLGLGAAVTRTVARATEPGQAGAGSGPLDEMVRNGASTLANLVRLTVESLRASTRPPVAPGQVAPEPRSAPRPGVHAGDTLRMPLFIENPSADPTGPMRFSALDAASFDLPGGPSLGLTQIRCAPESLEIGARDFEKLTVFVDTSPATALGRHQVRVGVPGTAFATTVEFDVLPAR